MNQGYGILRRFIEQILLRKIYNIYSQFLLIFARTWYNTDRYYTGP